MSISISATGTGNAVPATSADSAHPVPVPDKARAVADAPADQEGITVSLTSQDSPLALLYKSTITSVNETLQEQPAANSPQATSQGNTPQGTAELILDQATSFYTAYKLQHGGVDDAATLAGFLASIRGGVGKGFQEARDILQGLNALSGEVAGNIDQTYQLVQQGLNSFAAAHGPVQPLAA